MFKYTIKLSLVKTSAILDHMWRSKGPNSRPQPPPSTPRLQKRPLYEYYIGTKVFNLIATNAITTIVYFHKTFNSAKN